MTDKGSHLLCDNLINTDFVEWLNDMNEIISGTYADAKALVESYVPLFRQLNADDIDWCVVGSMAVIIRQVIAHAAKFRMTDDIDVMLPYSVSNEEFLNTFVSAYAPSDKHTDIIAFLDDMSSDDDDICNMGIIGTTLSEDINDEFPDIDISLPNIDACRFLSLKRLDDFNIECVEFEGVTIPLGSVDDIIEMKQSTIDYLGNTLRNNPRRKDVIDIKTLMTMRANDTYDVDAEISRRMMVTVSSDRSSPSYSQLLIMEWNSYEKKFRRLPIASYLNLPGPLYGDSSICFFFLSA